jgi:hypothetical protein
MGGGVASCWGLLASAASLIDVTATRSRAGAPGLRLHRSRSLDARDSTSHQGIAITSIARTLLDLAAPDHPRLVAETDGWQTHRTRAAFEADRRRDADLQADGWRVARFTWHEPKITIQRRLQALLHH